jgi:sugar phosphate isomerase/epimerase
MSLSRRQLLHSSALLGAGYALSPSLDFWADFKRRFNIGACDWSLGKSANIEAFELAKTIGLSGIQVNLGNVANDLHLRQPALQAQYLAASKSTGVKISSLAISELNNVPYKSDPRTEQWVSDSIDVARAFGVSVVLLAFFVKNDLRNDPEGIQEVIKRLKKVAPKAEQAGVILGIESYLTAEEHLHIMREVGSPAIKVFYDFRNAADAGNDIYAELKTLGKANICELHMKENRLLLGKGSIDWPRVATALREIGYRGDNWMQIEWAKPDAEDVVTAYRHNLTYLKDLF